MATIYLRSTTGSDANDGSSWALAKATLAAAITAASASNTTDGLIYVSPSHTETLAANTTYACGISSGTSLQIICVEDNLTPPTTLAIATGLTLTTSGGPSRTTTFSNTNGSALYCYGLTIDAPAPSGFISLNASGSQVFENCKFTLTNVAASGGTLSIGGGNTAPFSRITRLINCKIYLATTSHAVSLIGFVSMEGGGLEPGSATPGAGLFGANSINTKSYITGMDLSNLSSTGTIFKYGGSSQAILKNSKLPASWSGSLVSGMSNTSGLGTWVSMQNCDSVDTNYREWTETYEGSVKSETGLVATAGATNGTTPLSLKFTTNTMAKFPAVALTQAEDFVVWNEVINTPVTVSIEILTDAATSLNNNEIWMDVSCVATSGSTLGSVATSRCAVPFGTPVSHATSSASWTTTGMAAPKTQKLSLTVTPTQKGVITARVYLAKASTTVYVDPKLTVL